MLINGPTEWSKALIATGVKGNLLQDGYNPRLQVSAMPLGSTVVITRYADMDSTPGFGRGVLEQPADTLILHEDDSNGDLYRLVAWSRGSPESSLLAIASTTQVEIWEVSISSGISAALRGSVELDRPQGLAWSPCSDILLAYAKTDILLITNLGSALLWRAIHTESSTRLAWNACAWSPCGLQISLAQNHVLHCFSWTNADAFPSEPPTQDQIDASGSLKGTNGLRLDIGNASVGPIAAVARVTPTICILATDSKVVLEDISRAAPALNPIFSSTLPIETSSVSSLLLHPGSSTRADIQERVASSSNDIIDLTSIRISSSFQSSLQILNRTENTEIAPQTKPRSRLLIVEHKAQQWSITSTLDLPHLTSPDVIAVQGMRVIVGSTLSPRLIVAHLDVSDRMEWTASLSGELELPSTHVCRGIYLAERSPFADVASTEKRKRATFFHAAATNEPVPIYLSKFKVPRRTRPTSIPKLTGSGQESLPRPDKMARRSEDEDGASGESKELLELILEKMAAMQTQLNVRFDDVDKMLLQLSARVEQLERNGGTSAR
ncbi:hypothetical protein GN244_ATG00833 [Phytophthora infestans]|uniref:WD repeat and coiled-coil-containing protein n=1 Tax=Phytophthora infestans TaxID=4787 RepID=A0A833WNG7_PHYIN|nr:hypothetical protein GN244_ATG00833 [Phytophthora infestans]KAF4142122.1 hypothetical protein GN958_ATG08678 [Phytophthora infestans]